jgi:hypothetical protein
MISKLGAEYIQSAVEAGRIRQQAAQEFLRLVTAKTDRWVAQKMVEAEYAERIATAEAVAEVKLAYLKNGGESAYQPSED